MARVLEMVGWSQRRIAEELRHSGTRRVDLRTLELKAAKEILAEVFDVVISDVEEMIQNRYADVRLQEESDELWPKEFQL
jgi:AmiR/NasT family two-component response regulator